MIDVQKSLVYSWENENVAKFDKNKVEFSNIQAIVNHVWDSEGLTSPPVVKKLPKQTTKKAATGSRLQVRFPDFSYTWIILHELAHSMSSSFEGISDGHNATFLGIYIKLLNKYMGIDLDFLVKTATNKKLKFDINAKPCFNWTR